MSTRHSHPRNLTKGYTKIPIEVVRSKTLSDAAFRVYCYLTLWQQPNPSYKQIASVIGQSRDTVRRALNELEGVNLIKRLSGKSKHKNNVYSVNDEISATSNKIVLKTSNILPNNSYNTSSLVNTSSINISTSIGNKELFKLLKESRTLSQLSKIISNYQFTKEQRSLIESKSRKLLTIEEYNQLLSILK